MAAELAEAEGEDEGAAAGGEDERSNAERRALFVGFWPPMLWLIDKRAAPRRAAGKSAPSFRRG